MSDKKLWESPEESEKRRKFAEKFMSGGNPDDFKELYYGKFEPDDSYDSIKRRLSNTPVSDVAKEMECNYRQIKALQNEVKNSVPHEEIERLIENLDSAIVWAKNFNYETYSIEYAKSVVAILLQPKGESDERMPTKSIGD